jgi:hypothetical protein
MLRAAKMTYGVLQQCCCCSPIGLYCVLETDFFQENRSRRMYCTKSTTEYPAMTAGNMCTFHAQRTQNQPARMSAQAMRGMCATASATASILLIQTGVLASVSLFVLLIITISVVVLLGLLSLSGLTRSIIGLVGLLRGLVPYTQTGD